MKASGLVFALSLSISTIQAVSAAEWKPAPGPLLTRFAKDVSPEKVLPEYPRPQMVRKDWLNLNGLWQYAEAKSGETPPVGKELAGQILVPFPIESSLSGVGKHVERLWYRKTFSVPEGWKDKRVLIHFGAVDWEAKVYVNGQELGGHKGGYAGFSFDATEALTGSGPQELIVGVYDPTDAGPQPRGKQVREPKSIWYTPITGIWQTVWLEPVAASSISGLHIVPDIDAGVLRVKAEVAPKGTNVKVSLAAKDGANVVGRASGAAGSTIELAVPNAKLWSPDSPFLYGLELKLESDGKVVDQVESYFGMRKTSLGKDENGITRMMLNNKFVFQMGLLDQGFWPDGLYTAPTDEALRYDIEVTKKLGYNLARKHVKVEPARWYYWCDKLGLLVWQDMPSGDAHVAPNKGEITRTKESAAIYEHELDQLLDNCRNYPCIVMWVVFNEGWGQYDTVRLTKYTKERDPSRLACGASGWNDYPVGDIHDIHVYPGPGSPKPEANRAAVLGEYGGLGLPLAGHTWADKKNWGYRNMASQQELNDRYVQLLAGVRQHIAEPGLSAAIYTQTTDVEIEVNGVMTYDRAVIKLDVERVREAHAKLRLPPPKVTTLVPTARESAQPWSYTTQKPAANWMAADFDARGWKQGEGGFGTAGTPGSTIGTTWNTPEIWLRRTIELGDAVSDPHFVIHHDEDTEVYVNGVLAAAIGGYTTDYKIVSINPAAKAAIKKGKNTIAIHCKQTGGGQFIDLGIVDIVER